MVTQPLDIYTSGDFSGDGKTGFVLKNADTGALSLWRMNRIVKNGGYAFNPATTSATVQGAADFDGDGRTDLVLQNPTTGGVTIWYLGQTGSTGVRTTRTASANLSLQLTNYLAQKIVGVTDYNGDGHSRICDPPGAAT